MNFIKLSESLGVSGQIRLEDLATIAAEGYKVVVNNRPDGEQPGQPTSAEVAAAALQAGLEYHHMPVGHADFPGADFDSFAQMVDNPQQPVFAFCRSGTRCANLWVACRPEAEVEDAIAVAQRSGFDLGFAAQFFSRREPS
jgi:uncharacterized protein (TIGR01244 family)